METEIPKVPDHHAAASCAVPPKRLHTPSVIRSIVYAVGVGGLALHYVPSRLLGVFPPATREVFTGVLSFLAGAVFIAYVLVRLARNSR